jgi:phage-related protein
VAVTVGSVEFDVDADGSGFERQLRRIAKTAGASSGKEFDKSFSNQLSDLGQTQLVRLRERMVKEGTKSGRLLGRTVRQAMNSEIKGRLNGITNEIAKVFTFDNAAFEKFRKGFSTVGEAVDKMADNLRVAHEEGRISVREFDALNTKLEEYAQTSYKIEAVEKNRAESTRRLRDEMTHLSVLMGNSSTFNTFIDGARNAGKATDHLRERIAAIEAQNGDSAWAIRMRARLDELSDGFGRVNKSIDSNFGKVGKLSDIWNKLGHNTKQWTLIIGAVLAGMQQLAVLGSAAGAGLLVMGGALSGALVGLGSFIAAWFVLGGDAEKVPDSIKEAASAFRDLKTPLKELQNYLAERAFRGTERAFRSLGDTIRRLTPAFGPIGDAINRIVNGFADWAASEKGVALVTGLIEKSAPIFERLMGTIGTLGEALLIAFNNPAFQTAIGDFLTTIEKIFDTFHAFVSSDEFGVWIEETSSVLGKFGDLIVAVSDMIDGLVTPEAYERTRKFLDNLTDFMPHLENLLDILGRLDIFGIIAEALREFGDAMEPLAGPLKDLADGLARIVEIAIDEWGDQLKPIAEALAPFVQGLADLINNVPEEDLRAIARALGLIAGGLLLFKGIKWLGMLSGLTGFFGSLRAGNGVVASFNLTKLKNIAKGLGAFALIGAAELIPPSFWKQFDIESNLPQNVLTGAGFGLMFGAWGALIGAGIGVVVSLFQNFEATMNDIGFQLQSIFTGGPMGAVGGLIAQFFAGLVPEEWRGSDNPLLKFLADAAFVVTDTGTAIKIVTTEIGAFFDDMNTNLTTAGAEFVEEWNRIWAVMNTPALWEAIGTQIRAWITTAGNFIKTQIGQVGENWSSFWARMGDRAAAAGRQIDATVNSWVSQVRAYVNNLANDVVANFTSFWNQATNFTRGKTNEIMATVAGMINMVRGTIAGGLNGAAGAWNGFWGSLPNAVAGAVGRIQSLVNGIVSAVQRALGAVGGLRNAGSTLGRGVGGNTGGSFASGGILSGPRRILAGEAGPEAIVPLNRNLSQVHPSVRELSAFAQGRMPAMANGGIVGGSRTEITVMPGAIVINGADDAEAVALAVMNRLADFTGS